MSRASNLSCLFAILMMAGLAHAQTVTPPPCKPDASTAKQENSKSVDKNSQIKDQDSPCPPASSKEPSASERFPFPGESTPQKSSPPPTSPEAPTPSGKQPSAADKFPFPSSAPPMPGSEPNSGSNSSSSSSSDSSSSADEPNAPSPDAGKPPLDDKGDNPKASVRRRLPKVEKLQSDEERAAEDLKVAKFYEDAGNLNAAYLRAQDAVKYQPNDPYTHFALAHVAEKLNKREQAIAEYNEYLKLDPDGLKIKQAHKSLEQLER